MHIPKRYIVANVNAGWKLEEGTQFQSIDLKNLSEFTSFRNKITLQIYCENCGEDHATDIYPLNKLSQFIYEINLAIYMNQWNKYKCKMDRYNIKHSKKETHTQIIHGGMFGFDGIDDEEEEE